ncbi:addiction module protein [Limnoglobus roseus]|uniref:Addiction module component n=1 Tax=Limnoglobus roseus TaxID=2598579 RepID=A0A5C1A5U6_9BACT|nr:addiction module protein [Limnoglobus roseus]QEL13202.1 addiction module component [Limnoglobus roseus]
MSERAEKLKAIWNELAPDERAELFAYFESQQGTEDNDDPGELSDEWIDEINRRVKAHENGETTGMPADEFMAKMKAKYG